MDIRVKAMTDEFTVSVIIPAFNCEDTIVEVLRSIEKQSCNSCIKQVLIVDDGSTDNTATIVDKYKSTSLLPIELLQKENGGVSTARNMGVSFANSDWIAFCDSDDAWYPNKLEKQIAVIAENSSVDALGCAWNSNKLKIGFKTIDSLHKATVHELCIKNYPQPSTVIIKKSVFTQIGGFDETQKYAEDGNFFLKVAKIFNLYYLPEQLIEYGRGKRGFGASGLSANLKGMHEGNIKNLKEMYLLGYINLGFYALMRIFYVLKYWRRIVITRYNLYVK